MSKMICRTGRIAVKVVVPIVIAAPAFYSVKRFMMAWLLCLKSKVFSLFSVSLFSFKISTEKLCVYFSG